LGALILILVIVIPVAVIASKKHDNKSDPADPQGTSPGKSNLDGLSHDSIPVRLIKQICSLGPPLTLY
jgi:glucan 1,3-beta-glucosidase